MTNDIDGALRRRAADHHQYRPVEYETRAVTTPTWTAGSRRLREEHDHRRRPKWTGGICGGSTRPDAQPKAHPLAKQVGVPALVVVLNKTDMSDTRRPS